MWQNREKKKQTKKTTKPECHSRLAGRLAGSRASQPGCSVFFVWQNEKTQNLIVLADWLAV